MKAKITLASRMRFRPPWRTAPQLLVLLCAVLLMPPRAFAQQLAIDWGDAPLPYPVNLNTLGARHVVGQLRLGTNVDGESEGAPSPNANSDDLTPAGVPDDEDGIVFLSSFVRGQSASIRITASGTGILNAWMDYNRDGDWDDAGEHVFADVALAAGVNTRTLTVPTAAVAGTTYARFRFSTSRGLTPRGPTQGAVDGEVEDYILTIANPAIPTDFGDAPETPYPTTLKNNGARHSILQGFSLGASVDAEQDGQPTANSDGDDLNPATAGPDENGVKFVTPIVPGQLAEVEVTLTSVQGAQGRLDAWLDFYANGNWTDNPDQIFRSVVLSPGLNVLTFTVPPDAKPGVTFSRWRLSQEGGLPFTGDGGPGEVEDHRTAIESPAELDFGDAPQIYPVMLTQDGARHRIVQGIALGRLIDSEADGQPSSAATADDNLPAGASDDEDGVRLLGAVIPGQPVSVEVTSLGGDARLDAWIDFNKNGNWDDAGEQIFNSQLLNPGPNTLIFTPPAAAVVGDTFSRWRLSFQGGLKPRGAAPEGEVEDHLIRIEEQNLDYGDAPQSYPVLLSQDGARHRMIQGFQLGPLLDLEPNGQPSAAADGDDLNPTPSMDDEDGVKFLSPIQPGAAAQVEVNLNGAAARLDAWMDFNRNGTWDHPAEQIFNSRALSGGANLLSFNVPVDVPVGENFLRFRVSRQGSLLPTGLSLDGEVEDYRILVTERQQPCTPRTNKGTDFWLTFPGNYAPDPDNPVRLRLCIVGPRDTAGTVSIPGLGWSTPFLIGGTMEVTIALPSGAELASILDIVVYRGINVTAENEVAVFGLNRVKYTTDGFLGLPTDVIGRRYIIQAFGNEFTGVPDLNGSQFALVATEDDTKVTIVPSVTTFGHTAGVPYTVTLPRAGDCYQLRNTSDAPNDLSGTIITADKNVSVFGSHQSAVIPDDQYFFSDYIVEQLLPVERAGTSFVSMPLASRSGGDTFRFTAVEDSTTISVNGVAVATINAGQRHERIVSGPAHITATRPILTAQYANSSDYDGVVDADPFMIILPHVNMFLNNYMVCTPHPVSADLAYSRNYINIVAPNAVVGTLTLNGAALAPGLFVPIGASGYSGARIIVGSRMHSLAANLPFGVILYGWAEYDSYGFPGGMSFGDTTPPQLTCPPDTTIVLPTTGTAAPICATQIPDLTEQVQVRDDCGLPQRVVVLQEPKPGTVVGPGQHVITFSAADAAGNVGYCQMVITVVDSSPVEIICPEVITATCTEEGGAYVEFEVIAKQACGENLLPVKSEPPSGSFFPEGETLVTSTVEDIQGNVYTCEFYVVVSCDGPRITVTRSPGSITLHWSGNTAVLEGAPSVLGPWTPVDGAQGTYTLNPSNNGRGFFRLRVD